MGSGSFLAALASSLVYWNRSYFSPSASSSGAVGAVAEGAASVGGASAKAAGSMCMQDTAVSVAKVKRFLNMKELICISCHNSGGGLLRHCPSLLPLPGHGDAQEREACAEVMVMPTYHAKCAQTIFIHIGRQNEYISARKQVLKSYGCCCNSSSSSGCCCCCCSVAAAAAAAITRSSLATAAGFILIRASRRLEEARELHSP